MERYTMPKQLTLNDVRAILCETSGDSRTCVPVLGSGVNLQAAMVAGRTNKDDWEGLLRKVADDIQMSPQDFELLPKSNLMRWETMVRQCAVAKAIEPHKAEGKLQKLVCMELRQQEKDGKSWDLYGEFLGARFADIVSLNFDRRIALCAEREEFHTMRRAKGRRGADESIYRHSLLAHENGATTRIWYPHGDTKKVSTLKFGVRKYGDYIAGLEGQRRSLMARWTEATKDAGRPGLLTPKEFDLGMRRDSTRQITWPAVFLMRPLVFIGCSLAWDEWPLWWLLHQRARIFARFAPEDRPPTVCLCAKSVPENLVGRPGNVEIVKFATFERLWSVVRRSLR
jgi:hypothetical protein